MRTAIVALLALPVLAGCLPEPAPVEVDVMDVCDVLATYDAEGVERRSDNLQVVPDDFNGDGQVIFCAVLP